MEAYLLFCTIFIKKLRGAGPNVQVAYCEEYGFTFNGYQSHPVTWNEWQFTALKSRTLFLKILSFL